MGRLCTEKARTASHRMKKYEPVNSPLKIQQGFSILLNYFKFGLYLMVRKKFGR